MVKGIVSSGTDPRLYFQCGQTSSDQSLKFKTLATEISVTISVVKHINERFLIFNTLVIDFLVTNLVTKPSMDHFYTLETEISIAK